MSKSRDRRETARGSSHLRGRLSVCFFGGCDDEAEADADADAQAEADAEADAEAEAEAEAGAGGAEALVVGSGAAGGAGAGGGAIDATQEGGARFITHGVMRRR